MYMVVCVCVWCVCMCLSFMLLMNHFFSLDQVAHTPLDNLNYVNMFKNVTRLILGNLRALQFMWNIYIFKLIDLF